MPAYIIIALVILGAIIRGAVAIVAIVRARQQDIPAVVRALVRADDDTRKSASPVRSRQDGR